MLEQLLTEREVMRSLDVSFYFQLNRMYNLKEIVKNGEPQTWQKLADELARPLQKYIKKEYGFDIDVSPVVPCNDAIFWCIQALPYYPDLNPDFLWGIRMKKIEWSLMYTTAIYDDLLNVFKYRKHNKENPEDRVPYFFITSEVNKVRRAGGNEIININAIPDYRWFVYTVAHEVGHTVGKLFKIKREDNESFASTFGLRFMEWYMSQELIPFLSTK